MKNFIKNVVASTMGASARRVIGFAKPTVIGVTGSAGKTSTKEAIGFVLGNTLGKDKVIVGEGNLNTEFGLPMVVLGIAKVEGFFGWLRVFVVSLWNLIFPSGRLKGKALVLEYGADSHGDIKRLVKIAPPNIAAVTIVGSAHTMNLGDLNGVAREKSELVKAVSKNGLVILNKGDKLVAKMAKVAKAQTVLVEGVGLDLARNIAKIVAVEGFNVDKNKADEAISNWVQPAGRLRILSGKGGITLIDDTYNANPPSTLLALNELKKQAGETNAKRKIAVLGDMLELGDEEEKVHKGAALAAQKVADVVITVGHRYGKTGIGNNFDNPNQAAKFLLDFVKRGDLVLLKGSQSMRIELITKSLLQDKKDEKNLVRQSKYWKSKPYKMP